MRPITNEERELIDAVRRELPDVREEMRLEGVEIMMRCDKCNQITRPLGQIRITGATWYWWQCDGCITTWYSKHRFGSLSPIQEWDLLPHEKLG